jgi:uncharacterized membrane protein
LELGNFSSQNINLSIDDAKSKTDDELIQELQTLIKDIPNINPKLKGYKEMNTEIHNEEDDEQKKVVKH